MWSTCVPVVFHLVPAKPGSYTVCTVRYSFKYSSLVQQINHTVHSRGINTEKKALYQWSLTDVQTLSSPMMVRARRGRTTLISSDDLETFDGQIPSMSLKSTAEFFVNRLSCNDTKKLATVLQKLDGKTIRVGTTCSGTDVIIPVLSCTFETLSRMFNETRFVSLICWNSKSHHFREFQSLFFLR